MKKNNELTVQMYFVTRVKNLPYHECLINKEYREEGLAQVFISKKMPSGNYCYAIFLLDVYCLGLKKAIYNYNYDQIDYADIKDRLIGKQEFIPIDIVAAHNLIYGMIDHADDIGFKPHENFAIVEHILNEDLIDDGIDEVEFGLNGKPHYVSGPYDDEYRILKTLEKTVGVGNFEYAIDDDE